MFRNLVNWLINGIVYATCNLEVNGLDNIPEEGNCIVASNHLGRMDVLLSYKIIKRSDIILTIAEKYGKFFVFRLAADALDAIFIDRYNVDFRGLRIVIKRLKQGGVLVIAPEGTRSQEEALMLGKMGTAYLAKKTNSAIIPVALTGTEDRIVKNNLMKLKRSKVSVTIGQSFRLSPLPKENRNENLRNSTDEIMCRIAFLLPPKYRGVYANHPRLRELSRKKPK